MCTVVFSITKFYHRILSVFIIVVIAERMSGAAMYELVSILNLYLSYNNLSYIFILCAVILSMLRRNRSIKTKLKYFLLVSFTVGKSFSLYFKNDLEINFNFYNTSFSSNIFELLSDI